MEINGLGFNNRINTSNLQSKSKNIADKEDKELMEVCKEFESIFLYMMFKEMKKSVPKDGLIERSSASETFEDMYLEEMSKDISSDENSIGLAKQMYEQFRTSGSYKKVDEI